MNLLAFENIEQYKEVLNDNTFVKIGRKTVDKFPTVGNKSMLRYRYDEWQPDAPYVILLNRYKTKHESESQWVKKFKGKRLCVIDGGDKDRYWEPFVSKADIYIKDNSYTTINKSNIRIGCYCPSMKVPFLVEKHTIEWRNDKKWDYFFCGDMHKGRDRLVSRWKKYCKKEKYNYKFGDEHEFGRPRYLKNMSLAKVCLSFKGYGARCRREWEALLCGSMLLNDPRLKKYPFVIMQPEKHFTFKNKYNEKIARAGYVLARKCWMQSPSIDMRMAALYTFFNEPQMWTYEDVVNTEKKHGLY